MSSSDRLLLILHVGFAIFTLGPLTAAIVASPRYIRRRDVGVLRYLNRATRLYGLAALGILLFGVLLAHGDFARVWLTAALTLFVVALVLLVIVERDQRRSLHLLRLAAAKAASLAEAPADLPAKTTKTTEAAKTAKAAEATERVEAEEAADGGDDQESAAAGPAPAAERAPARPAAGPGDATSIAEVERGRITVLSGVISLLWLVILFLMIWYNR